MVYRKSLSRPALLAGRGDGGLRDGGLGAEGAAVAPPWGRGRRRCGPRGEEEAAAGGGACLRTQVGIVDLA